MLHLRMITPHHLTEQVVELIDQTVGTTHLVVLTGAAREPEGDVVMCDVAREAADELLQEMRTLGIGQSGSIAVENIDLSISRRADAAEEEAPGEAADAVIWEQLAESTHEESTLTITFSVFLIVATMIAACGVVLDNAILIVGAMAVGPEFGPLAGICTGLVQREPKLAARSMFALLVGFAAAIVATTVFSLVMNALGLFHAGMLDNPRPNTSFIWQPDPFSFVVALLAGVAGMLSLTSAKSGALVGVAISVTTVPAAANAAVALSYGEFGQMWGSALQLLLNLCGIILSGTLTLIGWKLLWRTQQGRMTRPPGAPQHNFKKR
ncbi:TIGR00341 family protein [Streptomyces sp. NBC_00249]|uniref:TIGR00341 family protein n=1 Tax=Streptomyces sp. NBC_00249 TaxID=2975690 RepID=UPI00224E200C|nr:TIGR00341 family protein [Streptomyces sp. NBC_00249]MCX5194961.1 TIGR00341 family protein [Streptomyces sp. NBC_00249]